VSNVLGRGMGVDTRLSEHYTFLWFLFSKIRCLREVEMTAFFAIVKLTCRSLVRSRVFQLLLATLAGTIIFLPLTVVGDGTALAHIQVSLKYSLGAVGMILSASIVWVGCSIMGDDVASRQLHMVVSKPVSKPLVWLAKWTGVVVSHGFLLLLSAGMVYVLVLWRFERSSFSDKEKKRIRHEVLTGRRVFLPKRPDLDEIAAKELDRRLSRLPPERRKSTPEQRCEMLWQVRKEVVASLGAVPPGRVRSWEYSGLTFGEKSPLYLRYRAYVGKVDSNGQRETRGMWLARVNIVAKGDGAGKDKGSARGGAAGKVRTLFSPRTNYPEVIPCGVFVEITMNPNVISKDGSVEVRFVNYDPQGKQLFFQPKDGPKLLVEEIGFISNYLRAVLVLFAKLAFLAGVACAAGGIMSTPVAIFGVVSYILAGSFSAYLIGVENWIVESSGIPGKQTLVEVVGNSLSKVLLLFIMPIQNFEVSGLLAKGELIEWGLIGQVVFFDAVVRGVPLMLLGMWLYSRRELGLAAKK